MSTENINEKTSKTQKTVSEPTKEAFLLFQQMQSMYDANMLKIGAKLLEKPKPFRYQQKNKVTGELEDRVSYKLVFGFNGGSITESVEAEMYESSSIGDKFLLEGYIKSTAENKTWEDKSTSETKQYATTTLNPAITKITRLDLEGFMNFAS